MAIQVKTQTVKDVGDLDGYFGQHAWHGWLKLPINGAHGSPSQPNFGVDLFSLRNIGADFVSITFIHAWTMGRLIWRGGCSSEAPRPLLWHRVRSGA